MKTRIKIALILFAVGCTLEALKNKSISRINKDGALSITLQPDSFVVFVDNGYESNSVIQVKENQVIKAPFHFFHCTSY